MITHFENSVTIIRRFRCSQFHRLHWQMHVGTFPKWRFPGPSPGTASGSIARPPLTIARMASLMRGWFISAYTQPKKYVRNELKASVQLFIATDIQRNAPTAVKSHRETREPLRTRVCRKRSLQASRQSNSGSIGTAEPLGGPCGTAREAKAETSVRNGSICSVAIELNSEWY